jgi:tetratricopeptide (TPR) repeat protein
LKRQTAPEIQTGISTKGKMGREAWERGDTQAAESLFLEAWGLLPEPKTEYDSSQSLSRGLVTFYSKTGQFEKAKKWLDIMREAYGPGPNDSVEFMAGAVSFDAGDLDQAFRIFDEQFRKYKQRPFQGKDKKYLEFYKQRAAVAK